MLLLHPLPTCTDAGPHLCTFCADLCTLCLWCYPSINQRKYSTCSHGGGHRLQLALVFFLQPLVQTLFAPVVVPPVATCAGGLFLPPTSTHTPLAQASCTVWWWSVVVVVACGSGGGGCSYWMVVLNGSSQNLRKKQRNKKSIFH